VVNIEASLINGGLPNLFSPEYDRFAAKWDAVRSTFVENHWYWSGRRERWEWFAPAHFTVMDVGLEAVRENLDHAAYRIYPEVARSWERVRAIQGDAI